MNNNFDLKRYEEIMNETYLNKEKQDKVLLDDLTYIIGIYYTIIDNINYGLVSSEKQIAFHKLSNHTFTLLFELIINLKYDNFNSIFRVSRSILENKIFVEFISEHNNEQSYWYNNWYKVKQAHKLEDIELSKLYPKQSDYDAIQALYKSFITKFKKVSSNDYGFAQYSIEPGYITLKDITLSTKYADVDYEYYKYFSDLSHSSNETSQVMEKKLMISKEFSKDLLDKIYYFIINSIKVIIKRLNEHFVLNNNEYKHCLESIENLQNKLSKDAQNFFE